MRTVPVGSNLLEADAASAGNALWPPQSWRQPALSSGRHIVAAHLFDRVIGHCSLLRRRATAGGLRPLTAVPPLSSRQLQPSGLSLTCPVKQKTITSFIVCMSHTQPSACQTITQPPLPMQKMLFVFTISLLNIQRALRLGNRGAEGLPIHIFACATHLKTS